MRAGSSLWLLRRTALRRSLRRWPSSILVAAGIALAAATFLAVVTATRASVSAFADSVGGADLTEVRSRSGRFNPAELAAWLRENYREFDPIPFLESSTFLGGVETSILGTDLATDGESSSGTVYLPKAFPNFDRLSSGFSVQLAGVEWKFSRVLPLPGDGPQQSLRTLFFDIYRLQTLLHLEGKVSWVALKPRFDSARISGELPPGFYLVAPGERSSQARLMLAAFKLNVSVMVLMTLLVAAILILNAVQLSVLSAHTELATLRALGVSGRELASMIIAEGALFGFVGSVAGMALGGGLARRIASLFLDTAGTLYFGGSKIEYLELFDSPWPIVCGVFLGVVISIAGALLPAWQASKIPPALGAMVGVIARQSPTFRLAVSGLAVLAATLLSAFLSVAFNQQWLGQLCALGVVTSVILIAPAVRAAGNIAGNQAVRRSDSPSIILGNSLANSHPRAAGLVCMVSGLCISLLLGLGVMTGSFRRTLESWIDHTVQADLFIRAPDRGVSSASPTLPPDLVDKAAALPGVAFSTRYEKSEETVQGLPVAVAGAELSTLLNRGVYKLITGECNRSDLVAGKTALVSEVAARKIGKNPGEHLSILGKEFAVCGIFADFASQSGSILLDRRVYEELASAAPIFSVGLYLDPGAPKGDLLAAAKEIFGMDGMVMDNAGLKEKILDTFDRTFSITEVIRILLFVMALGGAFVSMVQLLWGQADEIREFRLIGGSSGQVYGAISIAAVELGLIAGIVGLGGGLALAAVLIKVINPVSFGWTLQFHPAAVDFLVPLLAVFLGVLAVALISGRYLKSSWNSLGLRPVND